MNTHDKIVKCRSCGYVGPCDPTCCERPDYDGATAEEAWQAAIEADRKRRGEPVAFRVMRKTYDGKWVTDGRGWCDGAPSADLLADIAKRSDGWRIEHAYAAPQPAEPSRGEPVAWHSKLCGTVWMAIKPGSLVPGTQWFIDGRTEPVAEVISPDSLVWHIPTGDLPHGTVFYSAPQPAEPVTHNDCDLSGQFERSDIENHRLRRAMQKIMARLTELLDEDQFATIEGIATDAGVEPPAEPVKVQHVDDINVADIPAVSAEHATLNLQPSSSMQPVATAFFTEKGEVAFTGLFDRTLKALEAVKTTRMGISSGSIDLYAAPQAAEPVKVSSGLSHALRDLVAIWRKQQGEYPAEGKQAAAAVRLCANELELLLFRYGQTR